MVDSPSSLPNFRIYFWMGEILRGSELLVYKGGDFSATNLPLKLPDFLISFWNSEILKGVHVTDI